ncbi:hypothetical protein MHB45_27575 [Peribacillus sp. FSL K6-5616]|uniref:hypothetical protein n=1 Tax=Peribacillus TaxID=2675229 RepID=UPI0030D499FF
MLVQGTKNGISGWLNYFDGVLIGEKMLVQCILEELAANKGNAVGDIMYCPLDGNHLADPVSVRLIIEEMLDEFIFFGKVPEIPQLPPGFKG